MTARARGRHARPLTCLWSIEHHHIMPYTPCILSAHTVLSEERAIYTSWRSTIGARMGASRTSSH
eukprot:4694111-Prymnesium_polylepis.1